MSDPINMAITETQQIVIGTIDKLKQVAIERRHVEGHTRKEFWDGYIKALTDLKGLMS